MDIKPIKTKADYKVALAEIVGLMNAEPDTPAGDWLDVLTTFVEAWEEKHSRRNRRHSKCAYWGI